MKNRFFAVHGFVLNLYLIEAFSIFLKSCSQDWLR